MLFSRKERKIVRIPRYEFYALDDSLWKFTLAMIAGVLALVVMGDPNSGRDTAIFCGYITLVAYINHRTLRKKELLLAVKYGAVVGEPYAVELIRSE